jgi:hypothetical protein
MLVSFVSQLFLPANILICSPFPGKVSDVAPYEVQRSIRIFVNELKLEQVCPDFYKPAPKVGAPSGGSSSSSSSRRSSNSGSSSSGGSSSSSSSSSNSGSSSSSRSNSSSSSSSSRPKPKVAVAVAGAPSSSSSSSSRKRMSKRFDSSRTPAVISIGDSSESSASEEVDSSSSDDPAYDPAYCDLSDDLSNSDEPCEKKHDTDKRTPRGRANRGRIKVGKPAGRGRIKVGKSALKNYEEAAVASKKTGSSKKINSKKTKSPVAQLEQSTPPSVGDDGRIKCDENHPQFKDLLKACKVPTHTHIHTNPKIDKLALKHVLSANVYQTQTPNPH